MKTLYREMDTGTGVGEKFSVLPVCEKGIITILVGYTATGTAFVTAVTNVRCSREAFTLFFIKVFTMLIAAGAGTALYITSREFITYVGTITVKTLCAEVMGIIEKALACIVFRQAMLQNFFRDGGWILA